MSNTNTDNFLIAARKKLRIDTNCGSLLPEDLFDLPLTKLDTIAVQLDEAVSSLGRKTFLNTTVRDTNDYRLKFEIVKSVIDFKLAENAAAKDRATRASRKAFLEDLLVKKQTEALEGLSSEEIEKQLSELEGEQSESVTSEQTA